MKRSFVIMAVLCFVFSFSYAQTADTVKNESESHYQKTVPAPKTVERKKQKSSYKKVFYGGSFGMSFGSYTSFRLYPMIGYRLTSRLSTGVKFLYEYSKYNSNYSDKSFHNYGVSVFSRYRFIPQAYIHAEYNYVNYEAYNYNNERYRYAVPYLFLGGGYVQKIGGRTFLYAEVLFDVLNDENSPYSAWNPFYSVGVSVGF